MVRNDRLNFSSCYACQGLAAYYEKPKKLFWFDTLIFLKLPNMTQIILKMQGDNKYCFGIVFSANFHYLF